MNAHRLFPVLLAAGVAGACAHEQPARTVTGTAVMAAAPRPARSVPAAPAPRLAPAPAPLSAAGDEIDKNLAVYFDFDSALLREDARPVLQKVASTAQARNASVEIEGNCDELGTVEYNLALGEHRAVQAKDYLTRLGVPSGRIKTVSYGSQRPRVAGHDEHAHAQNRRDDLIVN